MPIRDEPEVDNETNIDAIKIFRVLADDGKLYFSKSDREILEQAGWTITTYSKLEIAFWEDLGRDNGYEILHDNSEDGLTYVLSFTLSDGTEDIILYHDDIHIILAHVRQHNLGL